MDSKAEKERVEELKREWRRLWRERIDDKVKAEGIAEQDYGGLFVDRGTVIVATRDFRALDFREILRLNRIVDVNRALGPDPTVGGWGKFVRSFVSVGRGSRRVVEARLRFMAEEKAKRKQQLKKKGRGWLHV